MYISKQMLDYNFLTQRSIHEFSINVLSCKVSASINNHHVIKRETMDHESWKINARIEFLQVNSKRKVRTLKLTIEALAGFVPWAETGIKHMRLWLWSFASWKSLIASRPAYSPFAPLFMLAW